MNKDHYEIKKDCRHKQITRLSIIERIDEVIRDAKEDVKITIEPCSKRSRLDRLLKFSRGFKDE